MSPTRIRSAAIQLRLIDINALFVFRGRVICDSLPTRTSGDASHRRIVAPNVGVIYTGSSAKQAEHGGFAHDDTNVMLLVSNPKFTASTVTSFVETRQVVSMPCKRRGHRCCPA